MRPESRAQDAEGAVGEHLEVHVPQPANVGSVGESVVNGNYQHHSGLQAPSVRLGPVSPRIRHSQLGAQEGLQALVEPDRILHQGQDDRALPNRNALLTPKNGPEGLKTIDDMFVVNP